MFNGRHCKIEDYWRLDKARKEIYSLLDSNNEVDLSSFFDLLFQYDQMIATSLSGIVKGKPNSEKKQIIKRSIDELLKNVLTDINEHN